MDVHVEFKNASKYQARKSFTHFYLPGEKDADSIPCADFDSIAISSALATLSSGTSDVAMLVETKEDFKPDRDQIQELADRFSSAIPEYEFSMASLQGYLMLYKTRPLDAVENVANWVDEEHAIQTAKKNRVTQDIDKSSAPTPPLTPANARILLTVPGQDMSAGGA
jgi:chaperone BCS1